MDSYTKTFSAIKRSKNIYVVFFLLFLLVNASASGAEISESDAIARGNTLSFALTNRLSVLQRRYNNLGNSSAALASRKRIPSEMENEIQHYRSRMTILISNIKDHNVQSRLQTIMEEMVSRSSRFISPIKAHGGEFFRNMCIENAYKNYRENWANNCKSEGKPDDCKLDTRVIRDLEENHRHSKDVCLKRYPFQ